MPYFRLIIFYDLMPVLTIQRPKFSSCDCKANVIILVHNDAEKLNSKAGWCVVIKETFLLAWTKIKG